MVSNVIRVRENAGGGHAGVGEVRALGDAALPHHDPRGGGHGESHDSEILGITFANVYLSATPPQNQSVSHLWEAEAGGDGVI